MERVSTDGAGGYGWSGWVRMERDLLYAASGGSPPSAQTGPELFDSGASPASPAQPAQPSPARAVALRQGGGSGREAGQAGRRVRQGGGSAPTTISERRRWQRHCHSQIIQTVPWHYIDVRRDGAEAPDGRKGDSNESVPRRGDGAGTQPVPIELALPHVRHVALRLGRLVIAT